MQLVITEKPSVAMDIAKALGGFSRRDGYMERHDMLITWAVGHLVELAMPQDYDSSLEKWNMETLPIIPEEFKYKAKASTKGQLKIIYNLMKRKDIAEIINACDPAREGENIFMNIYDFLKCKTPHRRLWLSETTTAAIKKAFATLRPPQHDLALAAAARNKADWIVGINATRGYSVKHRDKFTVGRVQTPTLALVVERDKAIAEFDPQDYFELEATFDNSYIGKWFKGDVDRFDLKAKAEVVQYQVERDKKSEIIHVQQTDKTEPPPMLLNLTDLQKECNKKFGFTADKTLSIAQKLYENHYITYPRTDSRHLTTDMAATMRERLDTLKVTSLKKIIASIKDTTLTSKRYVDDSKVSDHTAIILTDTVPTPMSADETQVYALIAKRMVGAFLPNAKIKETEIITACACETFKTKGKVLTSPGWKVLYDKEEEDDVLPEVAKGQKVTVTKTEILEKQTKPPKRMTDADLLSAMENAGRKMDDEDMREVMKGKGLGTPATRAAIIEKLISTGYINREKKHLISTEKGKALIEIIEDDLKSPELTAEWELKLMKIEQGEYSDEVFIKEICDYTRQVIKNVNEQEVKIYYSVASAVGTCPVCGNPIQETAKAFGCAAWREGCKFVIWKKIAGKNISAVQASKILKEGRSDLIRGFKSKKGNEFDAYLKLEEDKVNFEFPAKTYF